MSAVDNLLRRFVTLYGEPKTPDLEALLAEYRKALGSYSNKTLEAAADEVIRDHQHRSWPTIGECCKACKKIIEASPNFPAERYRSNISGKTARPTVEELEKQRDRAEWRRKIVEEHGSMDNFLQKTARGYVARSQPNAASAVRRVLTETSRRMTADQDDLNT